MKDDRILPFSSTRRGLLTNIGTIGTSSLVTSKVSAQQTSEGAKYGIGLPIEKQWSTGFADSEGIGSPAIQPGTISNDTMYLKLESTNYDPAKLVAYDLKRQTRKWDTTAVDYVSRPVVIDDTLLVSVGSHLKAYPATEESTSTLWEYETDMDIVSWPSRLQDKFAVLEYNAKSRSGGENDYTYSDGRLTLYDSDGNQQWSIDGDLIENPILYDDHLIHYEGRQYREDGEYTVTSGRVVARDFETGKKQWETPNFNIWNIRPTRTDVVLAHSRNDAIRGINAKTGDINWKVQTESEVEDFTAGPERTYIGGENDLRAVAVNTGEEVWSRSGIKPYDIEYHSGLIYVGAHEGNFYALDAETGNTVWDASHFSGEGFVTYTEGILYTFSDNWVTAYVGQYGKALSALNDARSNNGVGSITSAVADLFGRKQALSRAETAIDEQRYDDAMEAIGDAELRKKGVDAAATFFAGGTAYGGSRAVAARYREYSLNSALDDVETLYPIKSGALKGLAPHKHTQQAKVARDSLSQTHFGPPLKEVVTKTDDYEQLADSLRQFVTSHDNLVELSEKLLEHEAYLDVQTWRARFEEHFDEDVTEIEKSMERCRRTLELTNSYIIITRNSCIETFDLSSLESLLEEIQSPTTSVNSSLSKYCESALDTLKTYVSVQDILAQYDLSSIEKHIQAALNINASDYNSAQKDLESLKTVLTIAKQAENYRTSIDFSQSDLTAYDTKQWIQDELYNPSLKQIKQVRIAVKNLSRGIWKREHLHAYSPTEFEHLVAALYGDMGYRTQVTQEGSDGGIDVMAHGGTEILAIQVKQYSPGNKVGRPTIQQTAGVREQVGADKAVVVCSSSFTGTAKQASRDYGSRMELVNGRDLVKMLSQSSLAPPVETQSQNQNRHQKRRRQSQQSQSQSRHRQNSRHSHGEGMFCMVCGDRFQSDLEMIETPDGDTIRCCPRCKQLIEEATGNHGYNRQEAFKVLGLQPGASDTQIKNAYRNLVQEVHPDQGGNREEFQEVQEAYESLQ